MPKLHLKQFNILTFLGLSSFYLVQQISNWPLLAIWGVRGGTKFGDLSLVLRNVDCFHVIGLGIYESNTSDSCVNYVYGSWLIRTLDFFHLGTDDQITLGIIATLALCLVFTHILSSLHERSNRSFFLGLALILSPPIMLLLERANFDWLMFILLYFGAFFIGRGKFYTGIFLISLSVLFKFYTLPILIAISLCSRSRMRTYATFVLCLLLCVQIFSDLRMINSIFIRTWFAAFGNSVWAEYLRKAGAPVSPMVAGVLGLGVSLAIFYLIFINGKQYLTLFKSLDFNTDFLNLFTWFSVITFVSCYFAGMNFDYRLVFLLPLIYLLKELHPRAGTKYIEFLLVLIYWLSFDVKYLQPLGDILINIAVVLLLFSGLQVLKNQFRKVF